MEDYGWKFKESRTDMLARHARELAELESRWWEEWFTEDPVHNYSNSQKGIRGWITSELHSIIRKREKIGVTLLRSAQTRDVYLCKRVGNGFDAIITLDASELLAGRTLAPGERVEI